MESKCFRNENRISAGEKICVFILALCTILQHYRGLFVNASVTVLLLLFPYVLARLLKQGDIAVNRLKIVFPLMAFSIYKVVAHGTTVVEAGQAVVFIVYFAAIAAGCLNTEYFVRAITAVALFASLCIIVQYVCYYLLGFHLQLAPTDLFLERSEQWVRLAQTGRVSVTGKPISFYRPSAFFLEPSHMFIYMFPPLIITLLSPSFGKKELKMALLMTVGMIFSTSGMGILMTVGVWGLFLCKNGGDNRFNIRKLLRPRSVILLVLALAAGIALFIWVPFFRKSVVRIISSGSDYGNAVSGRVSSSFAVIKELSGAGALFGLADDHAGISVRMTGFSETMFQYGIVGTALSYVFFLYGMLRLKNQFFWISVIAVVLSFFSQHSHSSFFTLYCAFVFMEGYRRQQVQTGRTRIDSN